MNFGNFLKAFTQLVVLQMLAFALLLVAGETPRDASAVLSFIAVFLNLVSPRFHNLVLTAIGLRG